MTSLDLEIRDGPRTRVVPSVALAAILRVSGRELDRALLALLDPGRNTVSSEGVDIGVDKSEAPMGKGGRGIGDRFDSMDQKYIYEIDSIRSEEGNLSEDESTRARARDLAQALGDDANIGAIEKIVRAYPATIVDEALRRTLNVAPDRIRTRRAAYFTVVLRNLASQSSGNRTHSHDPYVS